MKVKEIVYMILDEVRVNSDDSYFTEDHIIGLMNTYRSFLLKKEFLEDKFIFDLLDDNYQELCLELEEVPAIEGEFCEGGHYLKSTKQVPFTIGIGNTSVYPIDYYNQSKIVFCDKDKMKWSGNNKYLKDIIYCSISPDRWIYLKSCNPQFLYLKKLKFVAIFDNYIEAETVSCEKKCDIMDMEFPMQTNLIPQLVKLIVQELVNPVNVLMDDQRNNAKEDNHNSAIANQKQSE